MINFRTKLLHFKTMGTMEYRNIIYSLTMLTMHFNVIMYHFICYIFPRYTYYITNHNLLNQFPIQKNLDCFSFFPIERNDGMSNGDIFICI